MGQIRLSGPSLRVLHLFLDRLGQTCSGAEISKATKVGSGTLYPLLIRLEDAGWLTSAWEDVNPKEAGRPRRRLYQLTERGQAKARVAASG
jgi:PadR family transcriptional regulator, regulatory protein PadR